MHVRSSSRPSCGPMTIVRRPHLLPPDNSLTCLSASPRLPDANVRQLKRAADVRVRSGSGSLQQRRAARLQNVSTTAVEISELARTRVERIPSANTLAITWLRPEGARHHQLERTSG